MSSLMSFVISGNGHVPFAGEESCFIRKDVVLKYSMLVICCALLKTF